MDVGDTGDFVAFCRRGHLALFLKSLDLSPLKAMLSSLCCQMRQEAVKCTRGGMWHEEARGKLGLDLLLVGNLLVWD